jgi:hypothetical protein
MKTKNKILQEKEGKAEEIRVQNRLCGLHYIRYNSSQRTKSQRGRQKRIYNKHII